MELLISAVNANVHELVEKMNIGTDAVLVNQASCDEEETIEKSSYTVRVYTRNERGVGRSRNLCLEKSTDEIVLFSDEDIVYKEGYNRMVTDAFEKHPEADALFFNVRVCENRRTYWNEDFKRVHIWNVLERKIQKNRSYESGTLSGIQYSRKA